MKRSVSSVEMTLEDAERQGELITCLLSGDSRIQRQEYGYILSTLHNSGKISLVSARNLAAVESLANNDFWTVILFLEQAIPKIDCSYRDVLQLVQTLVSKAGSDGAAGMPYVALVEWCKNNPEQSKLIVESAKSLDSLCIDHCSYALQGLQSTELCFELLNHADKRLVVQGIGALGRLAIDTQTVANTIIDACVEVLMKEQLLDVRSAAIEAVFRMWEKSDSSVPYRQKEFLKLTLNARNEDELIQISAALFYHSKVLTRESVDIILLACTNEVSSPYAILHWINLALHSKALNWDFLKVVDVFEAQLPKIKPSADPEKFTHFCECVMNNADYMGLLFSGWLGSGKPELCEFLAGMLSLRGRKNTIVNVSKGRLPSDHIDQIFLARKCVGYLWFHEITAASILLSIIKKGKKSAQDEAENLLYNPLLLSYSGELRTFLEKQNDSPSKRIRDSLGRLLKLHDEYTVGLGKTNHLVELIPSNEQRRAAAIKDRERNKDINKQAREGSIFSQMVSYETLLYGKKSFSIIHGPDGNKTPQVIPLSEFSYSAELPRLSVVDPVGYQEMLTIFRLERKVSK